jgi:maltose O-acetyltransferase
MRRFLDYLSYLVDNLLMKVKAHGVRYRVSRCPFIHESVRLGPNVQLIGPADQFRIGRGTYINDAIIVGSERASVTIGEQCAIGYRVSIKAVTHDIGRPHPDADGVVAWIEQDITIGDRTWIGDNVFIREGVTIGNDVIVGANSVVTRSVPAGQIVAGAPAVVIGSRPITQP